jgi:hypothetical protein
MRPFPERPDFEQLRRQARELQRAAVAGTPSALRRVRRVSQSTTLTMAQLALAREYGFASWTALKAEVEQCRARLRQQARRPQRPVMRTWEGMREWMASLVMKRTGHDVESWKRRMAQQRFVDETALRRWLKEQAVTGYGQTLLVWEQFGYPGYMTAGVDDLIGRQYGDRPQLKPILDAILSVLPEVSPVITVQARKTYISLVTQRRTFGVVQATTKRRVDLGLRLAGAKPGGRLQSARGVGNGTMSVKLPLTSAHDLDAEAVIWLKRAFEENA